MLHCAIKTEPTVYPNIKSETNQLLSRSEVLTVTKREENGEKSCATFDKKENKLAGFHGYLQPTAIWRDEEIVRERIRWVRNKENIKREKHQKFKRPYCSHFNEINRLSLGRQIGEKYKSQIFGEDYRSQLGNISVGVGETSGTELLSCAINHHECGTDRQDEMWEQSMTSSLWEERWVTHPVCLPVTSLPLNSCTVIRQAALIKQTCNFFLTQSLHLIKNVSAFVTTRFNCVKLLDMLYKMAV